MVAPIACGTNAVIGIPARHVPTIIRDIGHARNDIGHARGKSKATKKIQHKGRKGKEEHICLSRGYPSHLTIRTNWTLIVEKVGAAVITAICLNPHSIHITTW